MEYNINRNGESYELPKYTMKIAEKLEKAELLNNKASENFKNKCKSMYDFCAELLGKEIVSTLIGKFEESDPNEINILYLDIIKTYNKPLEDYQQAEASDKLNSMEFDKMTELLKAVAQSEKVFKVK